MTNIEWVKKFGEPEVLVGLGVDWSGYVPSGGWEWQEYFRNDVIPEINKSLSELNAEKAKCTSAKYEYESLLSGASKAEKFFADFKAAIENYGNAMGRYAKMSGPSVRQWLETSIETVREIKGNLRGNPQDSAFLSETNDTIAFLEAFKAFFIKDLEVDMLMWAQHNVSAKYFKKLFRTSLKSISQVDEAMAFIEHSTCRIANIVRDKFAQPIESLHKAYELLKPIVKKAKKTFSDPSFNAESYSTDWVPEAFSSHSNRWNVVNNTPDLFFAK